MPILLSGYRTGTHFAPRSAGDTLLELLLEGFEEAVVAAVEDGLA
jgi:hypothetical protein